MTANTLVMRTNILYTVVFVMLSFFVFILSSCGTTKKVASPNEVANNYFKEGEYRLALDAYEKSISDYEKAGKGQDCSVYTHAGEAAFKLGLYDKAIGYFKKAENSVSESADTYLGLAKCYKVKDNLSKEMMALQDYLTKFQDGKDIDYVKRRLFEIYVESENYDKAKELWKYVKSDNQNDPELLEGYMLVNKELNNVKIADSIAEKLLEKYPDNVVALEWEAKKYYNAAEKLYGNEMKAYEKNRTNKQYNHLIKSLTKVTADFKTSLGYFLKLYKIDPKPEYAKYLYRIYDRLEDKSKANYYKSKAGL
jgi:tetratricopeptide (TPR) repeat protein